MAATRKRGQRINRRQWFLERQLSTEGSSTGARIFLSEGVLARQLLEPLDHCLGTRWRAKTLLYSFLPARHPSSGSFSSGPIFFLLMVSPRKGTKERIAKKDSRKKRH